MVDWLSEATNSMAFSPSVVSRLVVVGDSLFNSTLSDKAMPLSHEVSRSLFKELFKELLSRMNFEIVCHDKR